MADDEVGDGPGREEAEVSVELAGEVFADALGSAVSGGDQAVKEAVELEEPDAAAGEFEPAGVVPADEAGDVGRGMTALVEGTVQRPGKGEFDGLSGVVFCLHGC